MENEDKLWDGMGFYILGQPSMRMTNKLLVQDYCRRGRVRGRVLGRVLSRALGRVRLWSCFR